MIGQTILHYKILEKLGEGGMGVVYKAEDLKLKRTVALKFLPHYLMSRPKFHARLEREAQAASSLNHPNICPVYAYHETEDSVFLVMEFVAGETLKQIIERDGPLPQERAKKIIIQIAEGLAVAHKNGVIHRDIKSENIMIMPDSRVKVMDFGLAKLQDAPTITKSGAPIGTLAYMSPELVQGKKVDHRTDLWSLGVVFFEMLTGELPFKGDSDVGVMRAIVDNQTPNLSNIQKNINQSYIYVIATLLEKNPTLRYQQAVNISTDLQRKIPATSFKLTLRKIRKNFKVISISLLALVLIAFALFYYYQTRINIPFWLKGNTNPVRLTNETGVERGTISPDGNYIAYNSEKDGKLHIQKISGGDRIIIPDTSAGSHESPAWSPDSKEIAYLTNRHTIISIFNLQDKESYVAYKINKGQLLSLHWSSDGEHLATTWCYEINGSFFSAIVTKKIDGTKIDTIITREVPRMLSHPTWHPDSKHILFYDYDLAKSTKNLHSIDIQKGVISHSLHNLKYKVRTWFYSGICCSPDGKYLIFPEEYNKSVELVALTINNSCTRADSDVIPITNFSGLGEPYWPSIGDNGKSLCYSLETGNRVIAVESLDVANARAGETRKLVSSFTDRTDYDANWSNDGQKIAFLSLRASKRLASNIPPDVFIWGKKSDTVTKINAPKIPIHKLDFYPNNEYLTFLYNGALWKISISDGTYEQIYPFPDSNEKITVRSYDWGYSPNDLYAIIYNQEEGFNNGYLAYINLGTRHREILNKKIRGSTYAEFQFSPQNGLIALRDYSDDNKIFSIINIIDPISKSCKIIGYHSRVVPQGQISWTPDGKYILYGVWDENVRNFNHYFVSLEDEKTLIGGPSFESTNLVKYPGKISPRGNEYIVSTEEVGADIWMIQGK